MLTIIAVLCLHTPFAANPTCHDEIVFRNRPMSECPLAQIGIAQWKPNSRFAGEEWSIGGYKCAFGAAPSLKDDRS